MKRTENRKATDYLAIGQFVVVPDSVVAPIVYSVKHPAGHTVRIGRVCELLTNGGVSVDFSGKTWDYSNKEALQFSRVY